MHKNARVLGVVYDVSWHLPEDYHKWGIHKYKIAWTEDKNLGTEGWSIKDLIAGHIVYVDSQAAKVLYGKV